MCGIYGVVDLDGRYVRAEILQRMNNLLWHRGPDHGAVYEKKFDGGPYVSLGHRRLSIIDLSDSANQPMCNENQSLWIVFNGEIYNFLELRPILEAKGHSFRSYSDTEVVLHAYEEWGVDSLEHFRGMFAFAIWDENKKIAFLARDRIGKKPLFYYLDERRLVFSSEIKAIIADDTIPREADYRAIHYYLTYQYVPSPMTAFKGIKGIPPAHYLLWKDGDVTLVRYWDLSYSEKGKWTSEESLCEEIRTRLREAVKLRLIADVPLGAFLSGGIDSSIVVAMMSELSSRPVKTFSIGFEEKEYDEIPYARLIANRYHTEHYEFIVKPEAVDILPRLVWYYNQPFADSSAIPTYHVSNITRNYVKVALNGDGGDETFGGYPRYIGARYAIMLENLPGYFKHLLKRISSIFPEGRGRTFRYLRSFFKTTELPVFERYCLWMSHFDNKTKEWMYTDTFMDFIAGIDSYDYLKKWFEKSKSKDFMDAILYTDMMTYLPEDLLVKVDVATMMNSIEGRSPFLDNKFMEFAVTIPSDLKIKGRTTKYILKKAFKDYLPEELLSRPKQGFGVPIDKWFRTELKEMAYDILLSRRMTERGIFREDAVKTMLDEHISGTRNWHYQLWNLLILELWYREFIDRKNEKNYSYNLPS
ncbi:MAG: asparagine synthase (glutamine-hydrolyzing) [Nitrospirota bacterium]